MMALVAVAAAAVVLVDCTRLRPGISVVAYFGHIGPLVEGGDVEIAGRAVGTVTAVQLLPAEMVRDPAHPLHPGGGVAVHLRIQRRFAGWASPASELFITAKGVLGEPYLAIGPPRAGSAGTAEGVRPLRDGDQLRGTDPVRMEQVVVRGFHNMTSFRLLMEELAQPAGELRAALAQLSDTLAEIEPAPGTYAELGAAVRRLDDAFERMKAGWSAEDLSPADLLAVAERAGAFLDRARAELGQTGAALDRLAVDVRRLRDRMPPGLSDRLARTLDQARAAIAKVERVVASATELATRVRQGHGTVGALMNDPEFSDDAKQLGRLLKRNPWRILGHPTREALEKQ
jgi:phospholipid/cholesterol/gamma-HCH transport system substrate-binding protein